MTTYTFAVTGMHCASCGMLIDETLEDLPGVRSSTTSVRAGRVIIEADDTVTPQDLAAAITAVGYPARPAR